MSVAATVKCYWFLGSPLFRGVSPTLLSHTCNGHYSVSSDGAHTTPERQSPNTFADGFHVALAVHTWLRGWVSSALEHPPPLPSPPSAILDASCCLCFNTTSCPELWGSFCMGTGGRSHHCATVRGDLDFPPASIGHCGLSCQTGTAPLAVAAEHLCCHSTRGISMESDNAPAN